MVRTSALSALSGAALVATASSFVAPSLLASSRPLAALSSSSVHTSRLSSPEDAASSSSGRSRRRRDGARMSTVEGGGAAHGEVGGGERYYGPTSKPLLDSVQSPADMKRFTLAELKQLAYELRWETLEVREEETKSFVEKKNRPRNPASVCCVRPRAKNCKLQLPGCLCLVSAAAATPPLYGRVVCVGFALRTCVCIFASIAGWWCASWCRHMPLSNKP